MPDSFVVCNSRQLLELTTAERECLDRSECVIVCNGFLEHWRIAGFRPTVWAMGDTESDHALDLLQRQLWTVQRDRELRQRLRHLFVSIESPDALQIVGRSGLPVTLYQRGHWSNCNQVFATSLYKPLYHRSTGVDLLNLAMILNPNGTIKLLGCQRGINTGHFYDPPRADSAPGQLIERPMWDAFGQAHNQCWDVQDCNRHHDDSIPDVWGIPRGSIL